MKKILLILVVALVATIPAYLFINNTAAEPIKDYNLVSPTVKIESYRLARNGDIYQANSASATIISSEGLLLTNSHVALDDHDDVYDAFAICLSFSENSEPVCEYSAYFIRYDKNLDLALLKLSNRDNRGGAMPALPYLDYNFTGDLTVGQPLDIYGYSDIGGETLTRTRGQLSGFEDKNGVSYLKTDADISAGNSGGVALDESGNFIGVPTYIISSYENLGYVLDIKAAVSFINEYKLDEPQINIQAQAILEVKKNILNDAKDNNTYTHPYYPRFSLTAADNWQWDILTKTTVNLQDESNEGDKSIRMEIEPLPFAMPQAYLTEAIRQIGLVDEYLTDFKQEETVLAGQPAIHVSYNLTSQQFNVYLIPYGASIVNVIYYVNLNSYDADLAEINQVINSLEFLEEPNNDPQVIETLAKSDPAFTIGRFGQWYIQRNLNPENENLIATYHNPNDVVGDIKLLYQEIDDTFKPLDNAQYLTMVLQGYQWMNSFKLINKNNALALDNLNGWSLTYSYEGEESQQIKKVSRVFLRDGAYGYLIVFEDTVENYNRYLDDFKNILKSFKNYNQPESQIGQGDYSLGTLDYVFSDIIYHRYEQAIANLVDSGVVTGYDSDFRPEKNITPAEARSFVAKSFAESKRTETDASGADFLGGSQVVLSDGLKALVQSFKLNLWSNKHNDAPAWKPYLDKGIEMNLLPDGIISPDKAVTRGEFTYMLYQLLESFEVI